MARTRHQGSGESIPLRSLPAAALRAVFRDGYSAEALRADVLAGLVVGAVALPLAMAMAIAVGAPPQHGLYTAIVAGLVVAALGGSRTQVTGPTAAFIVVLAPIYTKFGMAGLLLSGLLAGAMLLSMGLLRLGGLIEFVPYPVTNGFTAGIAVVIATLQIKDFFGLKLAQNPEHFLDRIGAMYAARSTATLWEPLVGLITLAVLLGLPRLTKRVPAPIVALSLAAAAAAALERLVPGFRVDTIASRFHTEVAGVLVHGIPRVLPMPLFPWGAPGPGAESLTLSYDVLRALLPGAFTIAMLGAIESLLSAVVADGMAQTRHDPDAELLALGIGNIVTPFFGGIPATGAIARTATNIRYGGRSPVAAMVHAITILGAILVFAPLLGYLPMSSLAALLMLVAWNMSEAKHVAHTLRVAPKSDVTVLLTCFALTVTLDMVVGVAVGMVLAAFLFMRRMAEVTQARLSSDEHPEVGGPLPDGVAVYEISGPLFFGAAQKAMANLNVVGDRTRVVILLMSQVHAMDATGLVALESAVGNLSRRGRLAVLSGVRPQPMVVLRKAGLDRKQGVVVRPTVVEALEAAKSFLAREES